MIAASRRSRVIARTREDILEAAARAFSRSGFSSATMRDIAREAGYTAASLYTYFKSKQEILGALVDLLTEEFIKSFDEPVPRGLTFRQRADLMMRRQLANAERRRELFVLLSSLRPNAPCAAGTKSKHNPFWALEIQVQRLTQWFRDNATPKDLGGHDPEVAARFVVGTGHAFLIHWAFRHPADESFDRHAELLIDLFFHGIGGAKAVPASGATKG
jgi:AcrR family transcriptional regulator